MFKQSNLTTFTAAILCILFTIDLHAQNKEVWTDMRPVFAIQQTKSGPINLAFPIGSTIDVSPDATKRPSVTALPGGSSMHHIAGDGWSMTYKISGNTGFSVSSLPAGGLRLSFPIGSDIDIRPGQLTIKPFRKTCNRWIMEFVPQRDGSVRVSMQPKS